MKVTVLKRNPAKARKAQTHFKKALALFKRAGGGKGDQGRDQGGAADAGSNEMSYAAAAALFYQAEAQVREVPRGEVPQGAGLLDRKNKKKKAEKSEKEFAKYLEDKGKKLEQYASKIYQDVIMMQRCPTGPSPPRRASGSCFQNFADALYTAPVPKPPIPKAADAAARTRRTSS